MRHIRKLTVGFLAYALAVLVVSQPAGASHSPIPRTVRATLLADASKMAAEKGDPHPYDLQVVRTPIERAERLNCRCNFRGPVPGGSTPIYVLAMRGHFSCGCSHPRGSKIGPATVITLYYQASNLSSQGWNFGGPYPDLKALGTPVRLGTPPPRRKT